MISFLVILLLVSVVSAGLFDNLFKKTGHAPQAPQDVSVYVGGAPVIDSPTSPDPGPGYDPSDSFATTTIPITIEVTDTDGVADLPDGTIGLTFVVELSSGAIIKTPSGSFCTPTDIDADTRSYACNIEMNHYDPADDWDLYIYIEDSATNSDTTTIIDYTKYNLLSSITDPINPTSLTWPSLASPQNNVQSDNDPTIVVNRGNDDRHILIRAYNLIGEDNGGYSIPSTSFAVSDILDQECTVAGVNLNADGINTDTGINANPGPNDGSDPDDCDGSNEVCVYYCLDVPAGLISQTYSTTERGEHWVVLYG